MRKILSYFMVFVIIMMSFGIEGQSVEAATIYEQMNCPGWTFNLSINQSSPYGSTVFSSNSEVATASITSTMQFYDPIRKVTWYYAVVSITTKSPGTAILSISQTSQKIYVMVTEHTWDEGVVTTEPTCSEDGIKTYTCSSCSKTKKEIITTTVNHVWETEYSVDEDANCTESGSKSIHCTVCGEQKGDSSIIIPAKGHNLAKKEAKEETCLEVGNKCYWYCDVCHKYYNDEKATEETTLTEATLPAKGHNLVKKEAKEETCLEAGNKCYWYCDVCHKYFNDERATEETTLAETTLSAKGTHTWDKGEVAVAATTTSTGIKTYKCISCGRTKTEIIPKVLENISNKKLSRTQIISKKVRNKMVKIKWKKVKNAKGYQIRYSKKLTMKGAKKLISKTTSIKLKKLILKKKYYFQVRAYSINTDGSKRYAKWSNKNKINMK